MDRIMIVDDSPTAQAVLANILDSEYQMDIMSDALLAIAAAESAPPDLILLDIHMPLLDGFEVCKLLKQSERTSDIPIIFISSLDSESEKVKGFEVGADDYIVKPVLPLELLARVRAHLGARKSRINALEMERFIVFKELAVTLCHEINNPLTTVNAYLHLLQRDFPEISKPVIEIIAALKIETERISAITAALAEATSAATISYNRDIKMIDLSRCRGET